MPVPPTDPAEQARTEAGSALHLPGAVHGWPRFGCTLPAGLAERVQWLNDYAAAAGLGREADDPCRGVAP